MPPKPSTEAKIPQAELSAVQTEYLKDLEAAEERINAQIDAIATVQIDPVRVNARARLIALAKTNIETGFMFAAKAIIGKETKGKPERKP